MCRGKIERTPENTLDAFFQGISFLAREYIQVSEITVDEYTYKLLGEDKFSEFKNGILILHGPSCRITVNKQ